MQITRKKFFIFLLIISIILFFIFKIFTTKKDEIIGVQILTSKGTVIVGRQASSKKLMVWWSPYIGYFKKDASPDFFKINHKRENKTNNNGEINWEWDELYKTNPEKLLLSLKPEDKNISTENFIKICAEQNKDKLSCQWNIRRTFVLEALSNNYLCFSELANDFYGGAHPLLKRSFRNLNLNTMKEETFDELFKDEEIKNEILNELYQNLKLNSKALTEENQENNIQTEENKEATNKINNIENNIKEALASQGYEFIKDAFCPVIKPEGIFLVFSFSQPEQANRSLNFKSEVLLNEKNLPKSLSKLFDEFKFSQASEDYSTKMYSKDKNWQISQNLEQLSITHHQHIITLNLPQNNVSEDFIGIFWIYKSPNKYYLDKYKFKEYKSKNMIEPIELKDLLPQKSE